MTICYDCGQEFRWVYRDGKLRPINSSDNEPHWKTCRARLKVASKGPAKRKQSELWPSAQQNTLPPKKTTGANYRPSCGKCDVPPWAGCACSFQKEEKEQA